MKGSIAAAVQHLKDHTLGGLSPALEMQLQAAIAMFEAVTANPHATGEDYRKLYEVVNDATAALKEENCGP